MEEKKKGKWREIDKERERDRECEISRLRE